jgi:hypothetical protein
MTKRIQQLFLSLAALGALALGGSAIASAQNGASHATASPAANVTGTSGSQTAPDTQGSTETAGESVSAEQPGTSEQPSSESAASNDGPGGHADEPGNATADNQFQGQQ